NKTLQRLKIKSGHVEMECEILPSFKLLFSV
ncbi:MAG: hypothetical protein ACI8RD_006282, partial [Bacillariaceae sp.]